jgi:hypothetical protein
MPAKAEPVPTINLEHEMAKSTLKRKKQIYKSECKSLKSSVKMAKYDTKIKTLVKALKAANKAKASHNNLLCKLQKQGREIAILKLTLGNAKKPLSAQKLAAKQAHIDELAKENVAKKAVVNNHIGADNKMIAVLQAQINAKSIKLHEVNKNVNATMQGKRSYIELDNELKSAIAENERMKLINAQQADQIANLEQENANLKIKQAEELRNDQAKLDKVYTELEAEHTTNLEFSRITCFNCAHCCASFSNSKFVVCSASNSVYTLSNFA